MRYYIVSHDVVCEYSTEIIIMFNAIRNDGAKKLFACVARRM